MFSKGNKKKEEVGCPRGPNTDVLNNLSVNFAMDLFPFNDCHTEADKFGFFVGFNCMCPCILVSKSLPLDYTYEVFFVYAT